MNHVNTPAMTFSAAINESDADRRVAYVVSIFPKTSETFIERELIELRRVGWDVHVVALRRGVIDEATSEFAHSALRDATYVYHIPPHQFIWAALRECISHPLQSSATICTALADALFPGEPTDLRTRLKLAVQVVAALSTAQRLRRRQLEHLHCHFAHAPTTLGMYISQQLGKTFSFTGHANDIFRHRALLTRKLARASRVVAISHWHASHYAELSGQPSAHFALVRCGVDTQVWKRADRNGKQPGSFSILTVCRLMPKKGVDALLESLSMARTTYHVPAALYVVGDGPERLRLVELSRQLGVEAHVRWLGEQANAEVRKHVQRADVFALLCRVAGDGDRDGIPVSLMEAMASEIPVVSGDLPAIRELIDDGVTGYLIDAESPGCVAQRFAELYRDDHLRASIGCSARGRVVDEFSLRKNVARLIDVFRQSMGEVQACDSKGEFRD